MNNKAHQTRIELLEEKYKSQLAIIANLESEVKRLNNELEIANKRIGDSARQLAQTIFSNKMKLEKIIGIINETNR